MPRGNQTGPAGRGPLTGRGLGYCAGYPYPGYMNPAYGRGCFGWGRGRGWFGRGRGRNWARGYWEYPTWENEGYYPPVYPLTQPTAKEEKEMLAQEKEILADQLNALKEEMKAIESRIQELGTIKKK